MPPVRSLTLVAACLLATVLPPQPAARGATSCDDYSTHSNFNGNLDLLPFSGTGSTFVTLQMVEEASVLYAFGEGTLVLADISVPTQPQVLGSTPVAISGATAIAVSGSHVYITPLYSPYEIHIVDVSDPANPAEVGTVPTAVAPRDLDVSGTLLYVAHYDGLSIFDISSPAAPFLLGTATVSGGGTMRGLAVVPGGAAYLVDGTSPPFGLHVFDVRRPDQPVWKSTLSVAGDDVATDGTHAYVVQQFLGFNVLDITTPQSPQVVGSNAGILGEKVRCAGGEVWTGYPFARVDVSDPTAPVATAGVPDMKSIAWDPFVVVGTEAFLRHESGIRTLDIGSLDVAPVCTELSVGYDVTSRGNVAYVLEMFDNGLYKVQRMGCWDVTDPLLPQYLGSSTDTDGSASSSVRSGALAVDPDDPTSTTVVAASGNNITVWDVSDPTLPHILRSNPVTQASNDLAVSGDWAYAAMSGLANGLGIVRIDVPAAGEAAVVGSFPVAGVAVSAGRAHVVEDGGPGFAIFDISSPPAAPVLFDGATVDAKTLTVSGALAYLPEVGTGTLWIYDTSLPASPTLLGSAPQPYPGCDPQHITVVGGVAYVACGVNGVLAFDVSDPTDPSYVGGSFGVGATQRVHVPANGSVLSAAIEPGWRNVDVIAPHCAAAPVSVPIASPVAAGLRVWPNPSLAGSTIRFESEGAADLAVFDVAGRQVRTLFRGNAHGVSTVSWDGRDRSGRRVAAGLYLVRLRTGDRVEARKVTIPRN